MAALFQVEVLSIDGVPLKIAESSVELENFLGFETETHPAALGEHGETRKRVVPTIKGKIQFDKTVSVEQMKSICNAQVVLKELTGCSGSARRVRCSKVNIGSMGSIGAGPVDFSLNVLGKTEWL